MSKLRLRLYINTSAQDRYFSEQYRPSNLPRGKNWDGINIVIYTNLQWQKIWKMLLFLLITNFVFPSSSSLCSHGNLFFWNSYTFWFHRTILVFLFIIRYSFFIGWWEKHKDKRFLLTKRTNVLNTRLRVNELNWTRRNTFRQWLCRFHSYSILTVWW